jgi:hypothetical protein
MYSESVVRQGMYKDYSGLGCNAVPAGKQEPSVNVFLWPCMSMHHEASARQ